MEIATKLEVTPEREDFLKRVLSHEGLPYLWAGKGLRWQLKDGQIEGLDCSGLVTDGIYHATKGRLDWRPNGNCNFLFDATKETDDPQPGDLCFYGPGKNMLTHVMVYIDQGTVFGASGGNSEVTSVKIANSKGARVKSRPGPYYRPDFRAFTKLPL